MTTIWTVDEIEAAADTIRTGGLVAFPTETVYGLGGDGLSDDAVAAIYAAKGRPRFNPLILHVATLEAAEALIEMGPGARTLAERFWPGPLTLVAPRRAGTTASLLAGAGLPTLAVRIPASPLARTFLTATGRPVAAPSANRSGRMSPTSAAHVMASLKGRIDGVLDGGPCTVGIESTIVGFDGEVPVLLRAGGLAEEDLAGALGRPLSAAGEAIRAPGQLASHYAPAARLRLGADAPVGDEVLLGFGPVAGAAENLSLTGDLQEAAARLFAALHRLDETAPAIAVSPIPERGLGRAINDRLRRAAAPRPSDASEEETIS